MLKIEIRYLNIAFFYTVVAIFILMLIFYVPGLPPKGIFVVITLAIMFSAFFYLLTHWLEITVIDKASGIVISDRGITPFRKVRKAELKEFRSVSIVNVEGAYVTGGGHAGYAVTLQSDVDNDFVLVCCQFVAKTWSHAVTIAGYLNLPLNDRLSSQTKVWSIQDLPLVPTWKDRKRLRKHYALEAEIGPTGQSSGEPAHRAKWGQVYRLQKNMVSFFKVE